MSRIGVAAEQESKTGGSTGQAEPSSTTAPTPPCPTAPPYGSDRTGDPTLRYICRLIKEGKGQAEPFPTFPLCHRAHGRHADFLLSRLSFGRGKTAKNIAFMVGAGISTSAGIPDFRSPDTGLYANLEKLNLPQPEAVFELGYFRRNPQPFWTLAQEIYPGNHYPTATHYLFQLLDRKNVLKTVFTQNIDTLELLAGLPREKVIDAHGSFATAHCLLCKREASRTYVLQAGVRDGQVVKCEKCGGLVKPDIVFFGEALPERFWKGIPMLRGADLLIVIGTSLQVHPFAGMIDQVAPSCPRVLINREAVGPFTHLRASSPAASSPSDEDEDETALSDLMGRLRGHLTDEEGPRKNDRVFRGDADEATWQIVRELGWDNELEDMVQAGNEGLRKGWKEEAERTPRKGRAEAEGVAKRVAEGVRGVMTPSKGSRRQGAGEGKSAEEGEEREEGEEDEEGEKVEAHGDGGRGGEDEDVVTLAKGIEQSLKTG